MSADFAATSVRCSAPGTDPASLTLEVTESVFVQDSDRAPSFSGLKELGSSWPSTTSGPATPPSNYLKRFPIDIIKIDRASSPTWKGPREPAIVAAVIELAHPLGMTVVAEASRPKRNGTTNSHR